MKKIIINADDYGLTPSVSKGIRNAHLNGILTSTTAMATGFSIENDAKLLINECPFLGVGVHLTLTSVPSVLPKNQISTLVNNNGDFFSIKELIANNESIDEIELYNEWKAQIEKLLTLGLSIGHLDSHHYVCYLNKKTINVMIKLAKEYNFSVRAPASPNRCETLKRDAESLLNKEGIKFPSIFYDDFTKQEGELNVLLELLRFDNNPANIEILSHAGIVDSLLEEISSLTHSRETELKSLCDEKIINLVNESADIQLTTFKKMFNN
ncbi:MAG: ChbG/HpnK family deacetylase [Fibromonadaceae bacterium]|jgi:predicted glycoside hydrolase/deacetylase ChbG (UPF0249 family)|nr:ChbG/HpnK family deacetylase [Fibromonadaceae bacterium]